MNHYSLSAFTNGIDTRQLHTEISESSIACSLQRVDTDGTDVQIVFDTTLSANDATTLNTIVANHMPTTTPQYKNILTFVPKNSTVSANSYQRLDTLVYTGKKSVGTIARIVGIGYMDYGLNSYTVRVYDKTNDVVIAETTFDNTSESSIVLSPITNVPIDTCLLELQVKKTGNKKAYVSNVSLYLS